MKVFRAKSYDGTCFIIAAKNTLEAHTIAVAANRGYIDYDDVFEEDFLQTNLKESGIIIEM